MLPRIPDLRTLLQDAWRRVLQSTRFRRKATNNLPRLAPLNLSFAIARSKYLRKFIKAGSAKRGAPVSYMNRRRRALHRVKFPFDTNTRRDAKIMSLTSHNHANARDQTWPERERRRCRHRPCLRDPVRVQTGRWIADTRGTRGAYRALQKHAASPGGRADPAPLATASRRRPLSARRGHLHARRVVSAQFESRRYPRSADARARRNQRRKRVVLCA